MESVLDDVRGSGTAAAGWAAITGTKGESVSEAADAGGAVTATAGVSGGTIMFNAGTTSETTEGDDIGILGKGPGSSDRPANSVRYKETPVTSAESTQPAMMAKAVLCSAMRRCVTVPGNAFDSKENMMRSNLKFLPLAHCGLGNPWER